MDTTEKLEKINAAIERCLQRVFRNCNRIDKLRQQKKRLERRVNGRKQPNPVKQSIVENSIPTNSDNLDIPTFLRRGLAAQNAVDEAAKAAIVEQKAAYAKRKKAGQDARRKAQLSGATKQMPLSGKAALAKIAAATN